MLLRVSFIFFLMISSLCAEELTLERAVENTLKLQADIITSKLSADASKRIYEGTSGPFDSVLTSNAKYASNQTPLNTLEKQQNNYFKDHTKTKTQTYSVELNKLTRSGISLEASAEVDSNKDISFNTPRESSSNVGVTVSLSVYDLLLENVNTTSEKIALENSRALMQDYFFKASTSVYTTVTNYWAYLAAYEKLQIFRESEQNSRKMLSDFEALVRNGERPQADTNQIRANLAAKHGRVITGEKDLATKGYELAKAMGVQYAGSELPPPRTEWVKVEGNVNLAVDERIKNAQENRFDIKSLEANNRSAELMLQSSRRSLKPELDVFVGGDLSDKGRHITGDIVDNARSATVGVSFSRPLENSAAESDLAQKEIALKQYKINLDNAKRYAAIDVASACNEFKQSIRAYEFSLQAVSLYHEALKAEDEKLKLGMSTVIDVINTQESYQNALLSKIDDLNMVAVALAGLAYDSGGMVNVDGDRITVNIAALYSLNTN